LWAGLLAVPRDWATSVAPRLGHGRLIGPLPRSRSLGLWPRATWAAGCTPRLGRLRATLGRVRLLAAWAVRARVGWLLTRPGCLAASSVRF